MAVRTPARREERWRARQHAGGRREEEPASPPRRDLAELVWREFPATAGRPTSRSRNLSSTTDAVEHLLALFGVDEPPERYAALLRPHRQSPGPRRSTRRRSRGSGCRSARRRRRASNSARCTTSCAAAACARSTASRSCCSASARSAPSSGCSPTTRWPPPPPPRARGRRARGGGAVVGHALRAERRVGVDVGRRRLRALRRRRVGRLRRRRAAAVVGAELVAHGRT